MERLRIAIRPYWRERWVKRVPLTPRPIPRGLLAALATAIFLGMLALAGCTSCADVDRSTPHGLSEWDKYGCGRD